jgi:hypothetical protein
MNNYLKVFIIVFVIAGAYHIGSAFVTGSVHIKGMREPIRRQDNPRDYWFSLGIITFIFTILVAIYAWIFLTSR